MKSREELIEEIKSQGFAFDHMFGTAQIYRKPNDPLNHGEDHLFLGEEWMIPSGEGTAMYFADGSDEPNRMMEV